MNKVSYEGIKGGVIRMIFVLFLISQNYSAYSQEADTSPRQQRSKFEYLDENERPGQRYTVPSLTDPTDTTVEQLKDRILVLEEKVERLEKKLGSVQ